MSWYIIPDKYPSYFPMKILFLIQGAGMGGVLRQLSPLVVNLDRRGHNISVIAMYPSDDNWQHLWSADSIEISTLFSRKPYKDIPGPITFIKSISRLREILKREKTEILYNFGGHATRFISWLAVSMIPGIKLVWGVRGSGNRFHLLNNDLKYRLRWYLEKRISSFIPMVIYNSDASFSFRDRKGHKYKKQLVIKNGFDTEKFKPDAEARNRMRLEWGVSEKEKLIGIAGRLTAAKGFHIFLKAAAVVLSERTDVRFVCVGDGDENYKRDLENLSLELQLTGHLIWAGVRSDMTSVFNSFDIYCSSSYAEGFPNAIGEAMACGVPCVVTDVGDSANVVGDMGIVVPHNEPEMLAKGLNMMLDKLSDIDQIRIRSRISENFTIDRMVNETENALQELLKGEQPRIS